MELLVPSLTIFINTIYTYTVYSLYMAPSTALCCECQKINIYYIVASFVLKVSAGGQWTQFEWVHPVFLFKCEVLIYIIIMNLF